MSRKTVPLLLVTANVGSIFEDPSQMLRIWTEEFLSTVTRLQPKFIALHCQEVGGKNYENSMKHVEDFVNLLTSSNELRLFDKIRVFLDEDYSSAENFTALGNLYFVHESIENPLLWNFKEMQFNSARGKEIHSGNIEAVVTKEKAKFPQDFFPECKWSRKGFLRTRWSISGTVFDLINIHLFHDASNFVAMEEFPSVYCKNRRRALEHTLQRFHNDTYGSAPYFLFGDFNFRTDTDSVVRKLTEGLTKTRVQNNKNNEYTKLEYINDKSELVLTIGKKEFNHSNHQLVFVNPTETWLKAFDRELEAFEKHLTEFPVTFPPSYPFEEKVAQGTCYMQTRCPAWCDRVLLSHTARKLIVDDATVEYDLIGRSTCMGDHKPVFLKAEIVENAGTVKCCEHVPFECLPVTCQCCRLFANVTINVTDMSDYLVNTHKSFAEITIDPQLLHEPITRDMLLHEPYTPESADSHSPVPDKIGGSRRNSVSPEQLISRLEKILRADCKNQISQSCSQNINFECDDDFRGRTTSELTRTTTRPRLISTTSLHSLARLQSHHSSSDEDWFEFDEVLKQSSDNNSFIELSDKQSISKQTNDYNLAEVGNKKKLNCCSIL